MTKPIYFTEELKEQWRYAFEQASNDRDRYLSWIKDEINIVIELINSFDKIYVLGGLGAKLLRSSPNFYNQFLETYDGPDKEKVEDEKLIKDDTIEVLLEYAMSIASAGPNAKAGVLPTQTDIDRIQEQLAKIKFNIGFYETAAEKPGNGNELDHWLKLRVMGDAMNVRGNGYHMHISEVYKETFGPHNDFLQQYYGFDFIDLFAAIQRLDVLVASKIATPFGASLAYDRLFNQDEIKKIEDEKDENKKTEMKFKALFGGAMEKEDLFSKENKYGPTAIGYDDIEAYNRLFRVIPENEKQEKIFKLLSHQFGDDSLFLKGKFGGFPLGDTIIKTKPLVMVGDKMYCFSINLAFRNIFDIAAEIFQAAGATYYENRFKGNSSSISRDNYIEKKVKELFEKMLPKVQFYHSLKYNIVEDGIAKEPELDVLGAGSNSLYIIEVKAGELNKKHRRGALLGLKDRINETINEGSYQCYRAEKYINETALPTFKYAANNKINTFTIAKENNYNVVKISVMYEHYGTVAVNLKYLIDNGIVSPDYKWTWIVSLYDLMVFADLIQNEEDFNDYLKNRFQLYERDDIEFVDELDVLGFFFEDLFPLKEKKEEEKIMMISYKDDIETYYTRVGVGMPGVIKPTRKINPKAD
ncbi:MAG: hypothetical protein P0Y49_09150 [Candidatus Pedobacter colombiensis]|uniref:Uncharacterized protein n=1 Tax=Candidatus Pedobacter colombiensis TaxID=3121371 RepID=A0AAJ5WB14_9SPHI|nr:hypothetical protein [Pedobacter sp.]WEK21306.1 MAG: hypothetical protein P0Y49_09150 [Pedobacter sp.]